MMVGVGQSLQRQKEVTVNLWEEVNVYCWYDLVSLFEKRSREDAIGQKEVPNLHLF